MKTNIRVADHLPFHEIEKRYRKATDGMARGHWQVIWLIAQGTPAQHVAEMTSYSYTWVRTLVQRYNHDGPDALGDRRHDNAGGLSLVRPVVFPCFACLVRSEGIVGDRSTCVITCARPIAS